MELRWIDGCAELKVKWRRGGRDAKQYHHEIVLAFVLYQLTLPLRRLMASDEHTRCPHGITSFSHDQHMFSAFHLLWYNFTEEKLPRRIGDVRIKYGFISTDVRRLGVVLTAPITLDWSTYENDQWKG